MLIKIYLKKTLFFIFIIGLVSCIGSRYNYSFMLLDDFAKTDKIFEDKRVNIDFSINKKQIDFSLKNLTAEPLKIIWDEASLIIYGESHRIIHKGVKYIDKNLPQIPTVIPPNAYIDDLVLPSKNIIYNEGKNASFSSKTSDWEIKDLLISNDKFDNDIKKIIVSSKGQSIKLFLPIEHNNQKINYTFEFVITDVTTNSL